VGFDQHVWSGHAFELADSVGVRFVLVSPDGDQGYPGTLTAEATYELDRHGALTLELTARTTATTVVSMTGHMFWNLAGQGVIDDLTLTLAATKVLAVGPDQVPLPGAPVVAGRELDFSHARSLRGCSIDRYFVLDELGWAATVRDPAGGRALRIETDQPGMGVYTGERLAVARSGLCLQPSAWPDAPNRPDFPTARLDPGAVYRHRTTYRLSAT
jgi:aldose 1-epimerase